TYLKALYKYPHRAFPYEALVAENRRRGPFEPEYELADTGVFDDDRYFDVFVEYAKALPDSICIRITAANRGPEPATLHLLPTLWFRNVWSWGREGDRYPEKPRLARAGASHIVADHATLGRFMLEALAASSGVKGELLFTENDTNASRLFGVPNASPY